MMLFGVRLVLPMLFGLMVDWLVGGDGELVCGFKCSLCLAIWLVCLVLHLFRWL